MSTNMQIAVTSTCKSDDKRKYKQLLGKLIKDASIGQLRNHVIFNNHVIRAVSGWFAIGMAFTGQNMIHVSWFFLNDCRSLQWADVCNWDYI